MGFHHTDIPHILKERIKMAALALFMFGCASVILNAVFNYPVTALLSSGLYGRYNNIDYIDTGRADINYTIGGNVRYQLSRNLSSSFDLKYRNRDSTEKSQIFDEWSVYASLVYGFGQPLRPTRTGGF